ncbi:MAG TPA: cbb3-type cytochrome c oxidase subunit 3 [Burkholderiales bacterium]|nr:cbb3-type cytochrome c oxidase subunit 3 [Burkholderiales bacterium]
MDLVNELRTAVTVLAFIAFIGIVLWAYSSRRKKAFDEAAQLPFTEDEDLPRKTRIERNGK